MITTQQIELIERIKQRNKQEGIPGATADSYPPVSLKEIEEAEALLGFQLPELLRELYLQVGNGGFGPPYKIIGLNGGFQTDINNTTLVETYEFFLDDFSDPTWEWPERLLPICDIGCAIQICIDCNNPDTSLVIFDPNNHKDGESSKDCFYSYNSTFEEWLTKWVNTSPPPAQDFKSTFAQVQKIQAQFTVDPNQPISEVAFQFVKQFKVIFESDKPPEFFFDIVRALLEKDGQPPLTVRIAVDILTSSEFNSPVLMIGLVVWLDKQGYGNKTLNDLAVELHP